MGAGSVSLDWKPIATAPRDGTWFMTYTADDRDDYCYPNFDFAKWCPETEDWAKCGCGFEQATHWAAVPSPPPERK